MKKVFTLLQEIDLIMQEGVEAAVDEEPVKPGPPRSSS